MSQVVWDIDGILGAYGLATASIEVAGRSEREAMDARRVCKTINEVRRDILHGSETAVVLGFRSFSEVEEGVARPIETRHSGGLAKGKNYGISNGTKLAG